MGTLLRAVIVGINDYADTSYRENAHLLFAKNDALDVANAIKASTAFRIESENFHVLVGTQATGRAIRDAMNTTFASRSFDNNTIALFYFAGHIIKSGDRLIICSHDINFSDPEHGGIRLNDIYDYLLSSSVECAIAIIDACFSGGLVNARHSFISTTELLKQAVEIQRGPDGKTVAVFAACRSDQESHEKKRLRHGVFTHALLQGLFHGEASDRDSTVSLLGLTNFLSRRFQDETQKPQYSIRGNRSIVLWHDAPPVPAKQERSPVKPISPESNLAGDVYVQVKLPTSPTTMPPSSRRKLLQPAIVVGFLLILTLCTTIGFFVIHH